METVFLVFVINYCAYCDIFKERAMEGIINSGDWDQVVVFNASESKFLHGGVSNIDQYKKHIRGYPTYIVIKDGEVASSWEGYTKDVFWFEYEKSKP